MQTQLKDSGREWLWRFLMLTHVCTRLAKRITGSFHYLKRGFHPRRLGVNTESSSHGAQLGSIRVVCLSLVLLGQAAFAVDNLEKLSALSNTGRISIRQASKISFPPVSVSACDGGNRGQYREEG